MKKQYLYAILLAGLQFSIVHFACSNPPVDDSMVLDELPPSIPSVPSGGGAGQMTSGEAQSSDLSFMILGMGGEGMNEDSWGC